MTLNINTLMMPTGRGSNVGAVSQNGTYQNPSAIVHVFTPCNEKRLGDVSRSALDKELIGQQPFPEALINTEFYKKNNNLGIGWLNAMKEHTPLLQTSLVGLKPVARC